MKLTFLGAAHEVTGSCTLLEACGKHILIDCGMEQGTDIYENCDLTISPGDIDAICLTHAHIDHSGKIPAMVSMGYENPIYSTYATYKLSDIMLKDSAHIQEFEASWRNRKARRAGEEDYTPLYTVADVEKTMSLFCTHAYNEKTEIFDGISIKFIDAGHLLGSSSILITVTENGESKKILFSGDIGNVSRPLIRDPQKPDFADYAVIESTYGNRIHGLRPDYAKQISEIINQTFSRGGNIVIPSFAVGRTQELLYIFRMIKENNMTPDYPDFRVYVDSPLAVEATAIYSKDMVEYYDKETVELVERGINPIYFKELILAISSEESRRINFDQSPKIILSASGMCEAGRIKHHLKHNLWRPESTILFVGYQSEGTLGRKIVDGAKFVRLFGEEILVRADIRTIDGISGHADRNMLLDWLKPIQHSLKKVFVNHGNDQVCDDFANTIIEHLGIDAEAPFSGDVYDLESGRCVLKGEVKKVARTTPGRRRSNSVYERLIAASKRLQSVIEDSRNASNKDISKLTDQILSLCDKYKIR